MFISILATIALLASTVAACLNAAASKGFTLRTPSGPDAMGIVVFFIFSLHGCVLMLVAAVLVASLGALVGSNFNNDGVMLYEAIAALLL